MALPRQVEAQIKELEALEKQLSAQGTTETAPAEPSEPAEPQAQQTTTAEPEAVEPQPKEEAKPKPADPPADDTWQQKYRTLKGMYDADVPRLHAQVKELTAQLNAIQKQVSEPKPVEPKAEKPKAKEKLVTDEDIQAFGSDLIEVQRKVAREVAMEFREDIDNLKAENAKLREQLAATGNQIVESTFEQKLHRMVPNFQEVNADPKWIAWLEEIDPILRGPRKIVAQDAYNRGDAEAVAHYVGMFLSANAPVEPPKAKTDELARQIQPSRSAATASQPAPKGKVYTNADIQKMFKRTADLGSSGRLDEARKLEAEIDAAFLEGRVTA